jgi:hypothetical protein
MVFNTTFNNISVISWRSVLLVKGTRVPGENHRPVESHWYTFLNNWRRKKTITYDIGTLGPLGKAQNVVGLNQLMGSQPDLLPYSKEFLYDKDKKSLNIWKKLTCASGPSSMLQLDHGFQFSWGGDQGTTPPVLRLGVGSNSSKDEWVSNDDLAKKKIDRDSFIR